MPQTVSPGANSGLNAVDPSPRILLSGRSDAAEFAVVRAELAHQLPGCTPVRLVFPVAEQSAEIDSADLIVVCQSFPDEFPRDAAQELLARSVSARLIVCWGEWCLSAGRTRSIWPPAVRVPINRFAERLAREIRVWQGTAEPVPTTATADEQIEIESRDSRIVHRTVLVESSDQAYQQTLEATLAGLGCQICKTNDDEPVDAVFIDVDPPNRRQQAGLRSIRERSPEAQIIALSCFPDSAPSGVNVVVRKDSGIAQLAQALRSLP